MAANPALLLGHLRRLAGPRPGRRSHTLEGLVKRTHRLPVRLANLFGQ
jgi:hypothetical protein